MTCALMCLIATLCLTCMASRVAASSQPTLVTSNYTEERNTFADTLKQ